MCILCEIKKMALDASGMEEVEKVVGVIGRGFIKEIAQLEEAKEILESQMEGEIKRLVTAEAPESEVEALVQSKYKKKWEDLLVLRKTVFNDALKAAGVGKTINDLAADNFKLNRVTGVLTIVSIEPKANVAPGVH